MEAALASVGVESTQAVLALFNSLLLTGALWPKQATVNHGDKFSHIIIGSGAGSVVANRLTENKNCTVLLIEAGDDPSVESMFAGLFQFLQNSYQDWQFKSEKEETSQSQKDDKFALAAGKCLGGTSTINHLVHARGDPCDMNSWSEKLNDPSYRYENFLRYFIKSENMKVPEVLSKNPEFHGTSGPVNITKQPKKMSEKYLNALEEVGNNLTIDYTTNISTGYSESFFINDIVRQSTAWSYLHRIKDRPNLFVLKKSLVIKILFDDNKRAYAVVILLDSGSTITVYAEYEIIVSCGIYNSPKLLMLSGIGPKAVLESFNIPVVSDLAEVGQNLQEHVAVALVNKMERSVEISEIPRLSSLPFPIILGMVNTDGSNTCPTCQTTNLILTHDTPYLSIAMSQILNFKSEIIDKFVASSTGRNTLLTVVSNVHPLSKGSVNIKSANYSDDPIIKMNLYEKEEDLDIMVKCIKDFIRVNSSTYFKEVGAELVDIGLENLQNLPFFGEEYIRRYVKNMTTLLYHESGTCSMGSVVDSELNVIGVTGLRVVDASVLPNITRANPLAATVALAEKISDTIKIKYDCNCVVSNTHTSSNSSNADDTGPVTLDTPLKVNVEV